MCASGSCLCGSSDARYLNKHAPKQLSQVVEQTSTDTAEKLQTICGLPSGCLLGKHVFLGWQSVTPTRCHKQSTVMLQVGSGKLQATRAAWFAEFLALERYSPWPVNSALPPTVRQPNACGIRLTQRRLTLPHFQTYPDSLTRRCSTGRQVQDSTASRLAQLVLVTSSLLPHATCWRDVFWREVKLMKLLHANVSTNQDKQHW